MNVVDSSGWLEFFAEGPNAEFFAGPINQPDELVVPTISLYEVFKVMRRQRDEEEALAMLSPMLDGTLAELNSTLALDAARLSLELRIPMADSIILATARAHDATVWTQDADFEGIAGVRYQAKITGS